MKTRSLFFSHNRQWALFRGAVGGILTKPLFQKTKRSAFRPWGQGESRLLLHLEEPTISIQTAFLPYPPAFVCFQSLFLPSLWKASCSGETPAKKDYDSNNVSLYPLAMEYTLTSWTYIPHTNMNVYNKIASISTHLSQWHIIGAN